ncbi:MAG: hypothetical protein AVDCRST_MAG77-4211, partial [uncultured Chloroflexi bacterium]
GRWPNTPTISARMACTPRPPATAPWATLSSPPCASSVWS